MKSFFESIFNTIDSSLHLRLFLLTFYVVIVLTAVTANADQTPQWVKQVSAPEATLFSQKLYMPLFSEAKKESIIFSSLQNN